jgi:fatty acid-binding protein DegV
MEKTIVQPERQFIYISHGDCWEDAEKLKRMVSERLPVKDIIVNYIGPIIGSHSGPDTLALFYLGNDREVPY